MGHSRATETGGCDGQRDRDRAGLSESWTYRKLGQLAKDTPAVRLARQRAAMEADLARIQAAFRDEEPADVARRARAFSAVLKASKDLEG